MTEDRVFEGDSFLPSKTRYPTESQPGLLLSANVLVVFCLDGNVYAVEEDSGRVLWQSVDAFTTGPLIRRFPLASVFEDAVMEDGAVSPDSVRFIVEPVEEGSLLVFEESGSVRRLPVSIVSLIGKSPMRLDDLGIKDAFALGRKETSVFAIDLVTGDVVKKQVASEEEGMLAERSSYQAGRWLLLGRTDLIAQVFNVKGLRSSWDVTFTRFQSIDRAKESKSETVVGNVFQRTALYATFDGHFAGHFRDSSDAKDFGWKVDLSSPVLQVFKPRYSTTSRCFLLDELEISSRPADGSVSIGLINNLLFALPQRLYPMFLEDGSAAMERNVVRFSELFPEADKLSGLPVPSRGYLYLGEELVAASPYRPLPLLDPPAGGRSFWLVLLGSLLVVALGSVASGLFLWGRWLPRRRSRRASSKVSPLQVDEEVLGYGSHGTVVYRGRFDGREVAVKRLLADFYELADHEIGLLQEHDSHVNVIRYFYRERTSKFIYIALELASLTLAEFIEGSSGSGSTSSSVFDASRDQRPLVLKSVPIDFQSLAFAEKIAILRQLMEGVAFLHSVNLVHRDLKPQNILLQIVKSASTRVRVLISDFGLSRRLSGMESSFNATAAHSGTQGWRAPETILNEEAHRFRVAQDPVADHQGPIKISRAVDIFASGLLFYYVLSGGGHPYGGRLMREVNISRGNLQLESALLSHEAEDLIRRMLHKSPKQRPSAVQVLGHPLFWSSERQLAFVCAVSDVLEGEERIAKESHSADAPPGFETRAQNAEKGPTLPLREAVDSRWSRIYPPGQSTWHKCIDRPVFQDITRHRYYLVATVHDLLRAIRNKRSHFSETPLSIQEVIGSTPVAAWEYFRKRFPRLPLEIWLALEDAKEARAGALAEFY